MESTCRLKYSPKMEVQLVIFWIQLKATDSKKEIGHIQFRFSKKKLNQLASYPVPVLIFRYSHY